VAEPDDGHSEDEHDPEQPTELPDVIAMASVRPMPFFGAARSVRSV